MSRSTRRSVPGREREVSPAWRSSDTRMRQVHLMRALTESEALVADKLFATLDTTVRASSDTVPRVLVSDRSASSRTCRTASSHRSSRARRSARGSLLLTCRCERCRVRAAARGDREVLAESARRTCRASPCSTRSTAAGTKRRLRAKYPDCIVKREAGGRRRQLPRR